MSKLASYYDEKTIFATGLTRALNSAKLITQVLMYLCMNSGCTGIVLVNKLLRAAKVRRIYALVRADLGKEQERLEGCWSTFAPLSAAFMKAEKRVVAIRGDITAGPNLGMSDEMVEKLKREVSIVLNLSYAPQSPMCSNAD